MSKLPFMKMHGTGNRILVVDNRTADVQPPSAVKLRQLGDTATGPGFDQLMWLMKSDSEESVAAYRVFNTDGSEVEQCGNGLRCLAWLIARDGQRAFSFESPAGIMPARVDASGVIAVSMGAPRFSPAEIPFIADEESLRYRLTVDDDSVDVSALSMGNPHVVVDVDDIALAPIERLGPRLESHARFPQKANVGFAHYGARDHIALRVFERGVGETLACGTGACAAVVSGIRRELLDEDVTVTVPGGELMVSWRGDDAWLSGQVTLDDEGIIDL
ncbi:MAG: diaminopimelate epimerase [Pseudomonadota bacterium]